MSGEPNLLYYGDNLDVLRRHVRDESVDLVYLDPPLNSNANYNVLFAEHGRGPPRRSRLSRTRGNGTRSRRRLSRDRRAAAARSRTRCAPSGPCSAVGHARLPLDDGTASCRAAGSSRRRARCIFTATRPPATTSSSCSTLSLDRPNFRNEIVWKRTTSQRCRGNIHRRGLRPTT